MRRSPSSARGLLAGALAGCAAHAAQPTPSRCDDAAAVIAHQEDVAALAGCAALRGLTVRAGGAIDTAPLRRLTAITGDLVVGPTVALDELRLDGLREVRGAIRVAGNGALRGIYLPALAAAARVEIDGDPVLTTVSLPRLTDVRGALRVSSCATLASLDVGRLAWVGDVVALLDVPQLELLELGPLRSVRAIDLWAPRLPAEVVARLRAAAGEPPIEAPRGSESD